MGSKSSMSCVKSLLLALNEVLRKAPEPLERFLTSETQDCESTETLDCSFNLSINSRSATAVQTKQTIKKMLCVAVEGSSLDASAV